MRAIEIIKKIPGFRSGTWWKALAASVFYFFGLLVVLAIVIPTAPTLALDQIEPTNKSSVTISGKTGSGEEVYLLRDGQQIQSIKADSKGRFYFPLNDLKDGNYAYTVQVCSSEERDKCSTENILIVIDQTPPIKPTIALPETLPDDSEEKIAVKGVTEPNAKVTIKTAEEGAIQETWANDKGEFEFGIGLALGANTIIARAIDGVGNESEVITATVNFNPIRYKAKIIKVIDGDTVKLETGEAVRYIGMDTPETVHPSKPIQCYAKEASDKNKELVEGKEVKLERDVSETDKYGRLLRYVWLGDILVNEYLTREGYARSSTYPPDVKYQDRIVEAERHAREERKGLWGDVCAVVEQPAPEPAQPQQPAPEPAPAQPQQTSPSQAVYTCNCSKTCGQMSSCEEAYYQLNTCGCSRRDGDGDGVPCESICR